MTHGEEPGSETHQDSAVLTYLEGLLMHQVAGGPGATGARRAEAGGRDGGPEPRPPPSRHAPAGHAPAAGPEQDRRPPAGGGAATSQHLRKARLLRSEEGWAGGPEAGRLRALGAEPAPALNGRGRGEPLQRGGGGGALEGSPKCKGGESTLLASLLQSFSSRLQTVALSQQIMQNLKQPEPAPLGQGGDRDRDRAAAAAAEPRPCLGAASSRLKGFLKKSKTQSHGGVPYRRRPAPGRLAPSPQPPTGGKGAGVGTAAAAAASASDSLSCAARLKAVASLVNTRASPAPSPSPRPSVACSQLALLLSSEAHLQQYSREQALKAQLSGRSASERLAAMATQQSQLDPGGPATRPSPDALASPNARNGAALSPGAGGGASSPRRTPQPPPKERRGFDRGSARPSQNCSSLLLHLLNNHHAQKHANGHAHGHGRPRDYREDRAARPARGSPLPSDGEYSSPENGLLPPRDSSDTESSRSSGSPIDLSVRSRAPGAPPGSSSSSSSFASSSFSSSSSSSLDRLTESLINRWRPENPPPPPPLPPPPPAVAVKKEPETAPPVRPHHKVTLLQLLLDHRNGEGGRGQRSSDSPDARQGAALQPPHTAGGLGVAAGGLGVAPGAAAGRLTPVCRPEESSGRSPHGGPVGRGFQAPPPFARGVDSNGGASRYSPCPAPPAQSAPLNLCKSEAPSNPDADAREPAFTASKLLQNLAQCGLQTPPKAPLPPPRLRADPPVTLLERLNTPILRNGTPLSGMPLAPVVSNGSHVSDAPRTSPANPPSEIQSLLERRTVLQLLLGATSGKEKPPAGGGRRKRAACGGVPADQRPDQSSRHDSPPPDVRIKTEPEEDDRAAPEGEGPWGGGAGETPRPLSAAARHADVKPEPGSPGAVPRDGLLSQLLRQRCRSLPVSAPTGAVMPAAAAVKEEPGEPQAPPTEPQAPPAESQAPPTEPQAPPIPKKRRVCIEGFPQERPVSAASGVGGARRSVSGSPERLATQNGGSPLEPDSPSRGPAGNSPPADARGGFNVLKQLLLSDNCLKDLSQLQPRRGSPSPAAPRPSDLHKLAASPWDHAPQGSGVAGRARSASPPPPWGVRDSPKANLVPVKREAEAEGTARWAAGAEERPDSPRLTQANPILYYMLQKSNSHLGRGGRGARGPLCSAGGAQGQPRVKEEEEPAPLAEDDDHKLNAKHHPHQPEGAPEGAVERLNGSLEKC